MDFTIFIIIAIIVQIVFLYFIIYAILSEQHLMKVLDDTLNKAIDKLL